jgi:hypothetical protein
LLTKEFIRGHIKIHIHHVFYALLPPVCLGICHEKQTQTNGNHKNLFSHSFELRCRNYLLLGGQLEEKNGTI